MLTKTGQRIEYTEPLYDDKTTSYESQPYLEGYERGFSEPDFVHHIKQGDILTISLFHKTYPSIPSDTIRIDRNLTQEQIAKSALGNIR